uniref:NADH dehydrogenase subunit 2 n=1 Tax=Lepophidium profundorum TaxID=334371 RepID=UPI0028D27323|nr:NADH dehydrogenase subunit 2 [Lepophidium profundorum]WMY90748.1 NADH dehydrogenase subunit 2 [Lepophidium profundorum]
MIPHILSVFLMSLGLGTTITFASSHWFLAWMGLEINTLAILPLMARYHHPRAVEATTKYFLTQATAAAMILFASTMNAWQTGQWEIMQMTDPLSSTLVILALALKIGLAPLHTWLPEVLQGLDLTTGLILSTWQKLAPFALILQTQNSPSTILTSMAILSTLIGGWGGLNQTQLRKILAYSSIAHLGWMILVLQFNPHLTMLALFIYITMTTAAFLMLKHNKATTLTALASSWMNNPTLTALTPLVLLSLAGLPPLTGFGPKWLILQELVKQGLIPMATLAAFTALLSLYFYLRLAYMMALTTPPHSSTAPLQWRLKKATATLPLATFTMAATMLLPLTPATLALMTF